MAKDNRNIVRGIRLGATTFFPGQEDELATAATPEQIEAFLASRALEGNWSGDHTQEIPTPGGLLSEEEVAENAANYLALTFGIQRHSDESASDFLEGIVSDLRSGQEAKDKVEELERQIETLTNSGSDNEKTAKNAPPPAT